MAVLSGRDLLGLCELATGLAPTRQALVLAAAIDRSTEIEELAALPVGQRDARLLRLRGSVAGPMLEAVAPCARCGELAEFSLDTRSLLEAPSSTRSDRSLVDQATELCTTVVDGTSVTWRCPTTDDLDHVASLDDPSTAESVLFERCILEIAGPVVDRRRVADRPPTTDLAPELRTAVAEAMAEADPLAEVLIDLTCAHCGWGFTAEVDVAEATWIELRAAAHRLLREIDLLARAYGWTEPEVLELSEPRRAAYLQLAMSGP